MFSASASKESPILCLKTSLAISFTSSGMTKALFFRKAKALAAIAKLMEALGDAPKLMWFFKS